MRATKREQELYGKDIKVITRSEDHVIYQVASNGGEVVMSSYQVFPGIELIYNDIHVGECCIDHGELGNILEINHCREGRIECEVQGEIFYLTPGDLSINRKDTVGHNSIFPLCHYHGITIRIDIEKTPKCLSCFLDDVNVRPSVLQEKFCGSSQCFVARSQSSIEHIFSELYAVSDNIKKGYFKVKILELLLFLSGMELSEDETKQRCFSKSQVILAKEVCHYLTQHMESRITISELAERFHVSQTALKNSFKGVYGVSVYTYIRQQKMQSAALLLHNSEHSVLEIAGMYGYDNASKFAGAFRDVMGMAPSEYRNQNTNQRSYQVV